MRFREFVFILTVPLAVSGCAVLSVVDTAVGVTTTVVGTTVDVAAGAVGAVAGSSSKKDKPDADKACEASEDDDSSEKADCEKKKAPDGKGN